MEESSARTTTTNLDENNENFPTTSTTSSSGSLVECAIYPLGPLLSQRLQLAVEWNQRQIPDTATTTATTAKIPYHIELDSNFNALSGLIGNCIEALDALYFSSSNVIRQHQSFQHRLCIRIATNPIEQTLTITDLGIGMTRSDLINCLGIGRTITSPTSGDDTSMMVTTTNAAYETASDDDDDDNDDDEDSATASDDEDSDRMPEKASSVGTESTAYDDEDDMDDEGVETNDDDGDEDYVDDHRKNKKEQDNSNYEKKETRNMTRNKHNNDLTQTSSASVKTPLRSNRQNNHHRNHNHHNKASKTVISCKSNVLGRFYAAFCTLGVGVIVRTKTKFDDYYEFQLIGQPFTDDNNINKSEEAENIIEQQAPNHNNKILYKYETFQIKRPYSEGMNLSIENGFTQFEQIRGESGTSITIQLNQKAIHDGLLNEQNILKPLFLKIVETTQYTVAFSTDTLDAEKIIQASIVEAQALQELQRQQQQQVHDEFMETDNDKMELASLEDTDMENEYNTNTNNTAKRSNVSFENMAILSSVKERSKYIPVRLSLGERKMLRLVEATMNCCDYTTQVDQDFSTNGSQGTNVKGTSSSSKGQRNATARRTHEQLRGVTAILNGLVTACDYQAGQKLIQEHNFVEFSSFYQNMFEIARRHKIMNPEKMRTEYGKMIYMLQDAIMPIIQQQLGFHIKGPIYTVYRFLEERNGLALLDDPQIERATEEILAGPGRTRAKIDQDIRLKERAVQYLKKKYKSNKLSSDDIHLCLYSICDNNSFLNSNRVPIDKILEYLTKYFSPSTIEEGYSLSILSGTDGARLTHSHERQYNFTYQSLTLWKYIVNDMFYLWSAAEDDLLNSSIQYTLQNTGQGMQRIQPSPSTYKAMQQILRRVQTHIMNTTTNQWIGSSVIHMGDHNVPNALSFIDKYTQVPRILGPIVKCLEALEQICEKDEGIKKMIHDGFGGYEKLKKDILYDFFKSAFDGSGADNFYDAGSCIDGRLTSAWNWCSQLPDKPYYPIFKLTGFIGFDGEFQ